VDDAVDEREIAATLGKTWFGSGLSLHARTRLAECARWDTVPVGATILREGDETSLFAVVVRGRVALRLHVPERGPVTILTVEAGDVVGWSALVPPHRSTSTAVALDETDLIVFHPRRLRASLDADLALAATLYPRLMEALGRRLGATRHQLLDLYTQQAEPVPW
jgi:CRP-like cAMP-binding protein